MLKASPVLPRRLRGPVISKSLERAMGEFSIQREDGMARTGVIRLNGRQIETPALLLYTKRGSPLYLTPDVLETLGPAAQCFLIDPTKL